MKILALEFSSPQRSVAVVRLGPGTPEAKAGRALLEVSEVVETGARPMNALGMIEEALRQAQLERGQIEGLAIGIGPGSYTGIRSAISLAQGWQLARGAKLLGISSAECIAAQAQAEGMFGRFEVVIDAQRGEFYLAGYDLTAENRAETEPLRLATMAEVTAKSHAGGTIIGPQVTKWFSNSRVIFPRAATLGELAAGRKDFVPGQKLEPIYLRETSFVKSPPARHLPEEDGRTP